MVACTIPLPHRHAPDIIDMVVRLRLAQGGLFDVPKSRMAFGLAISWPFFVQISSKIMNSFFVQNAKFRDFVRFASKTNFLCP